MSLARWVNGSLGAKVSLKLAVVVFLLTTAASAVITWHETRQLERLTLEKATTAARLGARYYGSTLERAIDAGLLTVTDAFDRTYQPILGHDWGDQPRFHSRYDVITDSTMVVFQDQYLQDPDFTFAVGMDDQGYVPTHDTVYSQPFTGDPAQDRLNEAKTKADDEAARRAARSVAPVLIQDHVRPRTGEAMWDVSAPVFVKGKHWGAFRVGVSKARAAEHQLGLLLLLTGIFAVFLGVTVGLIYGVVRGAVRPVLALTAAAEQVSLGEALDAPIKPTTTDEVGQLAKAIDRLRVSMRAAMSRLGH